jgi:hypothetical protein
LLVATYSLDLFDISLVQTLIKGKEYGKRMKRSVAYSNQMSIASNSERNKRQTKEGEKKKAKRYKKSEREDK